MKIRDLKSQEFGTRRKPPKRTTNANIENQKAAIGRRKMKVQTKNNNVVDIYSLEQQRNNR
jgi:hypothetical protein